VTGDVERSGSARVSRAGGGVSPQQTSFSLDSLICFQPLPKVRDGEDAITSTRDACATQKIRR
jgi:hypothetical protein